MKYWLNNWKRRVLIAMAIVGPGIITAVADNDAAGVSTYSMAAATFGYQIFIILIPMTVLLAVTQEIGARIAIVAEKGLADLIRERYGVRIALLMYGLLFLVNLAVVIMNVAGLKSALILFGLNPYIFLPAIIVGLFLFVALNSYSIVERFFLLLIVFYGTYIASAFLAKPDWGLALQSLVVPTGSITPRFLYTAIAVIGTTITAWGQFFINSYVKDKHLTIDQLKYSRLEVYIGSIVTDTLTFFLMVAVAATIFANKLTITDAAGAALAITPFAGQFAGLLFGVGLLFAGLLGCVIVALTTAYAFSEFFGYSGSLDEHFRQSRLFYTTLLVQLVIGTIVALMPNISLFKITLAANFINGAILPIIFFFLYQFANNEAIMGAHVNNKAQNWMLAVSSVIIITSVMVGIVGQMMGW
ncbi:divalent metal cation transporter [Patescibacteria group bacterium]|nr:divalent metal cation transporter [Patescibacteria group bacterium]